MVSNKFPCGVLRYFVGDITIIDHDNIYWVADCDVSTKQNLSPSLTPLHLYRSTGC